MNNPRTIAELEQKIKDSQITDEQREQELLLAMLDSSVMDFGKVACNDVTYDEPCDMHYEICDLVENEDAVVIAAPRGFAKSAWLARIYPMQQACFKRRKDITIISASQALACDHLRYIKTAFESNEMVRYFFGSLVSTDKWTEDHIQLKHPDGVVINIRAKGAGGQIRGYRPDLIIIDDLETDESVESEEQRRKLKNWLFKACINCLLPGGQIVVIGTILNQLSVLNDLLETPSDFVKRKYQAYKDGIEDEGHELWAARPHKWLQQRKKMIGSTRFSAEFMNDPTTDEAAPIKPEQIRYYESVPDQINVAIAVDPAYTEDDKGDYKVCVAVGIDSHGNRYLLDYIRNHSPMGEFIQQSLEMWERYRGICTAFGLPCQGTEREFYRMFVEKASDLNKFPPFTELKNTFITATGGTVRAKKSRIIAALQPLFENGKYFISPSHNEAREELLTINNARWDDLVDAMTYAEMILTPAFYDSQEISSHPQPQLVGGYGIEY